MERSHVLELPEDIIYHILSSLSNQDAIRLSLTLKQMLDLIEKRPTLAFNDPPSLHNFRICNSSFRKELEYIHSTLDRYHREDILLETLTLKYPYWENLSNQCVELAAKKGLRILKLLMNKLYDLPQAVFRVESLVKLELNNCHLNPERKVVWPNLKRLSLTHGSRVASVEALENIIGGCPSIENLELHMHGTSFKVVKLSELHNLKQLNVRLGCGQCLEVNAGSTPNLESMTCEGGACVDLGNTEFPNLKTLKLHSIEVDGQFLANFARKFPVLEYLSLWRNQTWKRMNLSSASLKEIRLRSMEFLQEACFEVPNLHFKYHNTGNMFFPNVSFTRNSGSRSCCIKGNIDASWFVKFNEFLVALNGSETSITIHFENANVKIHEAYRIDAESIISMPWIRELCIDTTGGLSLSNASFILEAIMLVCQPETVTFLDCSKLRQDHPGFEV